MILGVVLAGGEAARFGADKALAELGGRTLIAHAVDALSGWCEYVVVAGRAMAPAPTIPDWPGPDCGPLGGIAAGLRFAQDGDYELVLTIGVDTPGLPDDLPERLAPAPAYLAARPLVGLWPCSAAPALEALLENSGGRRQALDFAGAIGARAVSLAAKLHAIRTAADLAAAEKRLTG